MPNGCDGQTADMWCTGDPTEVALLEFAVEHGLAPSVSSLQRMGELALRRRSQEDEHAALVGRPPDCFYEGWPRNRCCRALHQDLGKSVEALPE